MGKMSYRERELAGENFDSLYGRNDRENNNPPTHMTADFVSSEGKRRYLEVKCYGPREEDVVIFPSDCVYNFRGGIPCGNTREIKKMTLEEASRSRLSIINFDSNEKGHISEF